MTKCESDVVKAWREASSDLGFVFTAPFFGTTSDGQRFEALGLVQRTLGDAKYPAIVVGNKKGVFVFERQ